MTDEEIKRKYGFTPVCKGRTTFNGIYIRQIIVSLQNALDKNECFNVLDKCLGKSGHLVEIKGKHYIKHERTDQSIEDDRENILNVLETTQDEELKINPTKIKWIIEWKSMRVLGKPQQENPDATTNHLPSEITQREFTYYDKAVKSGMAEKTEDGYKWKYNNGIKASLAYFLYKLFNPKGTGKIPYQRLNKLWGVKRLDSALTQMLSAKNPQQWRIQIDNLFTE